MKDCFGVFWGHFPKVLEPGRSPFYRIPSFRKNIPSLLLLLLLLLLLELLPHCHLWWCLLEALSTRRMMKSVTYLHFRNLSKHFFGVGLQTMLTTYTFLCPENERILKILQLNSAYHFLAQYKNRTYLNFCQVWVLNALLYFYRLDKTGTRSKECSSFQTENVFCKILRPAITLGHFIPSI